MNKKLITAVFLILFMVSTGADAELEIGSTKVIDRPSPETGPTKIETVIAFLDIDSINSATQTFEANVFVGLTWKDPRLTHSGSGPVKCPLNNIWNPTLQIANEVGLIRKTLPELAMIQPDGTVNYKQRYVGAFSQPLKLHDFPFDQHKFRLQLIAPGYAPADIQFVPNEKFVDKGIPYACIITDDISLPDWEILEIKTENMPYFIIEGFGVPGYAFEFTAKRLVKYYILKIVMPLFLIVMMSWGVFWIDPENSGTQIGIASTSMLTLIAYRFSIDALVPKVSYTTRLDEFIFMSSLIVFLALTQAIATSRLVHVNKGSTARTVDKMCRIVFPIVFFTSTCLILLN
jgi:hypothetical protein